MNDNERFRRGDGWHRLALAVTVITIAAGGCSFGGPNGGTGDRPALIVPDDPGMFAYDGEELMRLDGDLEWERETWPERSTLTAGGYFVIRDAAVATLDPPLEQSLGVRKVAWLRSEISPSGQASPVDGSRWKAAALPAHEIPVDIARQPDSRRNVVHIKPEQPLEPGLYSLYLKSGSESRESRFGIQWPDVDKASYSAAVCVDRYAVDGRYQACGANVAANPSQALRIFLVKPTAKPSRDGRLLVISGVVVNDSNTAREVPVMEGELRGANDDILARWQFRAETDRLEPGQSTSFKSELRDAPRHVESVNIDFEPSHASN